MTGQSAQHAVLEWGKRKLDEIDAILVSVEQSANKMRGSARQEAESALARIKAAQGAFIKKLEQAQAEAAPLKEVAGETQSALFAEWAKLEIAFQSFLAAAEGQAEIVGQALAALAAAQRKVWLEPLDATHAQALQALNEARDSVGATLKRIAAEAEKVQAKLGEAGEESLKAIQSGAEELRAVADRTWKKIGEAINARR